MHIPIYRSISLSLSLYIYIYVYMGVKQRAAPPGRGLPAGGTGRPHAMLQPIIDCTVYESNYYGIVYIYIYTHIHIHTYMS